jgi:CBS domain-containing protein
VVALDTLALARRFAPEAQLAQRMQGASLVGVFLRVAPFIRARQMPLDELLEAIRMPLTKQVGKRGAAVVEANLALIRAAYQELIDVTAPLRTAERQTSTALTADLTMSMEEAAQLMESAHVHRLVVVDDDQATPIGVISTTDLVRALARRPTDG